MVVQAFPTSATAPRNAYGSCKIQILDAAERLFSEFGFVGTTLKQIARESGANSALVSYYFRNKDGLISEVVSRQLRHAREVMFPSGPPKQPTETDISEVLSRICGDVEKNDTIHRLSIWALTDSGRLSEEIVSRLWDPLFSEMTSMILKAARSKITRMEAESRCMLFWAIVKHYGDMKWTQLGKIRTKSAYASICTSFRSKTMNQALHAVILA